MYGHHTNSRNKYQTSYKATFAVCRGSIHRLMRRCNLASLLVLVSRPNNLPWMISLSVRTSMRPAIRHRSKSPTRSSCSSQLISCHCLWSTVYSFGPYCITWTRATPLCRAKPKTAFDKATRQHRCNYERTSPGQTGLAQSVCLTIDLWSNRQMRGFIGITGHCIINWTMESVMLACKRFTGRHTAENIRQQYEETVASFDIAEKITNIVTDNASNMTKAFCFDLPGFDGAVEDAESDDDGDTNDENTQPDESCYELLPTTERDACFAHTINLCVNDGLLKAGQHTTRVLGTTSKIVAYVRKSVNGTEALASEKRLQPAVATR